MMLNLVFIEKVHQNNYTNNDYCLIEYDGM
jgi:hypothetical protein